MGCHKLHIEKNEASAFKVVWHRQLSQQSTSSYQYDISGNTTYDPHKKLSIMYNHLNLPYRIIGAHNDTLFQLYAANGQLLQRKYKRGITDVYKRDYTQGKEYRNDTLELIHHNDGRVIFNGATLDYEYNIKDHLGNVRVTFSDLNADNIISTDEVRSRNDYYAFGLEHNTPLEEYETHSPENKYRYNGKEFLEDMNWDVIDYGMRHMDPSIGRFMSVDPLAGKYPSLTPYSYVANNPLIYKDPTGAYIEPASQKEWDKQTSSVTQQRDKLQSSIDKLAKKAGDKGWSAEKLAGKIGDKQERINSLNSTISTFKTLEGSSQGYSLKTGAGEVGGTYYDNASGNVVIDFSNTANFVHEVTHAGQFESGDLAFDPNTLQGSYAHDLFDEVSPYNAELAYSGNSVGGALERATTSSSITADFVKRIATTTGALPYANHGIIPVNIKSSKADLLRAYPHAAAAMSGLPSSFVLKNLTDIIYKK